MGVDLTLLPLLNKDFWCAHSMVQLERRRELWDPILGLPHSPIPKPLGCFLAHGKDGEKCYGDLEDDPYGGRLEWTTAASLMTLRNHEGVQDNWTNRAAWAWLEQMPADWPIVLYWH